MNTVIVALIVSMAVFVSAKPSGTWGNEGLGWGHAIQAPVTIVGASGVVGPNGAAGPTGLVNGHGAVGPNGIPNAWGHGGVVSVGVGGLGGIGIGGVGLAGVGIGGAWGGEDDGQWHGEGILASRDLGGHGGW